MAINLENKPELLKIILPEVEINVTTTGISVYCDRLSTHRSIPFDIGGRCKECKASEIGTDFVVCKEGVTVWPNRLKGPKFLPFDYLCELPGYTFFKIRNKGRILNIPHGVPPPPVNCQTVSTIPLPPFR